MVTTDLRNILQNFCMPEYKKKHSVGFEDHLRPVSLTHVGLDVWV